MEEHGTAAGTVLVKDIRPGPDFSYPDRLANVNGTLFFRAADGHTGDELWKSDGTAAGTVLVKDINPNSSYGYPSGSNLYEPTVVGATLFFTADDGTTGRELWKTDGTEAGTVLVRDINPDANPFGGPGGLAAVGPTLFFSANDGTTGAELWKSDGTTAGTVLVKDINPTSSYGYPRGSFPHYMTNVNGTLFFAANDGTNSLELWKSDGTEAGTVLVKDIFPGGGGSAGSAPNHLTAVGGTLYFSAVHPVSGIELWKSDGTEAGTVLVADISPGFSFGASRPDDLAFVNGALFFSADDGRNGREPWILDDP